MKHKCEKCNGTGEVATNELYPWRWPRYIKCSECNGAGMVTDDLTDCPIPAENEAADTAQLWNEQRGA
jgi:DnaJ-class molecular chaperone